MNSLNEKILEELKRKAKRPLAIDEECSPNAQEAYDMGYQDGETELAIIILKACE